MHSLMLSNALRWPMMLFDTTPLGRILNRFSKDVETIDNILPQVIRTWLLTFFGVNSNFFHFQEACGRAIAQCGQTRHLH